LPDQLLIPPPAKWTQVPFTNRTKSSFDYLFDLLLQISECFHTILDDDPYWDTYWDRQLMGIKDSFDAWWKRSKMPDLPPRGGQQVRGNWEQEALDKTTEALYNS
jgi:hypothetical protein